MAIKIPHLIGALIARAVSVAYPPLGRWAEQQLNESWQNELLSADALILGRQRGVLRGIDYFSELAKQGINRERAEILYDISARLLEASDLVALRLRKLISSDEFLSRMRFLGFRGKEPHELLKLAENRLPPEVVIRAMWRKIKFGVGDESYREELRQQGWTDERINVLEKQMRFYPSPTDFIRFMVRDTFNEAIVAKYGYDEDYPKAIEDFVSRVGVDPEWMRHYWRAHWQLPSPTQAYEMLHRRVITREDMETLLKIADYPKFWRDKLIEISYNPLTRVDVRRMHKLGVLSDEDLVSAYMDLGYNEENARKLAEFTIRYNAEPTEAEKTEEDKRKEELRGLTRTAILRSYHKGKLTREEAKGYLTDIGLSGEVAEIYLDYEDYKIEEERLERQLNLLKKKYIYGFLTESDLDKELSALDLEPEEKQNLMEEWELEREGRPSLPSKSELIRMVKKKIIDLDTFKNLMSYIGYLPQHINWYIQLYNLAET